MLLMVMFGLTTLREKSRKDVNTVIWLCEQEFIQGVKLDGRWAVRVVRETSYQAGSAIVRDLKAGRDISIGSVIGQYVSLNTKKPEADNRERIAQTPVRECLDLARWWFKATWILVTGGALFFLVGLIMAWPLAAVISLPGLWRATQATEMAEAHGDRALIEEAQTVRKQVIVMVAVLWGGVLLGAIIVGFIEVFHGA